MHVLCECRALLTERAAAFGDLPQEIDTIRTLIPKRILRLCRNIIPAEAGSSERLLADSNRRHHGPWLTHSQFRVVSPVDVISYM